MKKLWKKYRAALLAIVSGIVGFDLGEVWSLAQGSGEPEPAATGEVTPSSPAEEPTAAACAADALDFSSLDWCWGGVNGGKASLVEGCEIGSLKVASDKLTYKWIAGGCEQLGAASRTAATCFACLFCKIDGAWRGGKFDWISTSRTSRDLKNIVGGGDNPGGYKGWDKAAITKADAYAFVIISEDCKKRSNVITCGK